MTTRTQTIKTAGRNLGLTVAMSSTARADSCTPKPTGLYWFSDLTGAFDQAAEAAYLLEEGAAGPLLGLARVLGETCDDVTWTTTWTPASGEGGAPGLIEEGASLIVYPLADTLPGILSVTATCAGLSFGPILLTVLRYACYAYAANEMVGWLRLPDNFGYSSYSGPLLMYGGADGLIMIGANEVTTFSFAIPGITKLWVYANDGGDGRFAVNGGALNAPLRGAFSPPSDASAVSITGLSSLELRSDGYGAPFYVFVK